LSTDVTGFTGTGLGGAAGVEDEAEEACWGAAAEVECGAAEGDENDDCLSCTRTRSAHTKHARGERPWRARRAERRETETQRERKRGEEGVAGQVQSRGARTT